MQHLLRQQQQGQKGPGQEQQREELELSGHTFDLVISLDARKITTFAVLLSKRAMLFFTTVSIAFRMITR